MIKTQKKKGEHGLDNPYMHSEGKVVVRMGGRGSS